MASATGSFLLGSTGVTASCWFDAYIVSRSETQVSVTITAHASHNGQILSTGIYVNMRAGCSVDGSVQYANNILIGGGNDSGDWWYGEDRTVSRTFTFTPGYVAGNINNLACYFGTYYYGFQEIGASIGLGDLSFGASYVKSPVSISSSSLTAGTAYTISVSPNVANTYVHTLAISFNGTTAETLTLAKGTTSTSWTPAQSKYAPLLTTAKSAQVTITCTTYVGSTSGTNLGTTTTSPLLTLLSTAPTNLSLDVVDSVRNNTTYIQNVTKLKMTASATAVYNATLTYSTTAMGTTYSGTTNTTGVVSDSGSQVLTLTVTDSRGFSSSITKTISIAAYSLPSISIQSIVRCNSSGTAADEGTYATVSYEWTLTTPGSPATIYIQYNPSSSTTWTTAKTYSKTASGSGSDIIGTFSDQVYTFRAYITDTYNTVYSGNDVLTGFFYLMDFKDDGEGMAIGKSATTSGMLDMGIPIHFSSNALSGTRTNLGLGSAAYLNSPIPIANGGTGATNTIDALSNFRMNRGLVGINRTVPTNKWKPFAQIVIPYAFYNASLLFAVSTVHPASMDNAISGIAHVIVRAGSPGTLEALTFTWLDQSPCHDPTRFIACYNAVSGTSVTATLLYKLSGATYEALAFSNLLSSQRENILAAANWTFFNDISDTGHTPTEYGTPVASRGTRTLFSNESQPMMGAITLADSAVNYNRFLIEYRNNDDYYGSVMVDSPDGKRVSLTSMSSDGTNNVMYMKAKVVDISGTTINTRYTPSTNYMTNEFSTYTKDVIYTDSIAITKVVGYI